tara:strand:- start:1461 stop:2510 length:1050 start_codon:yes stop_codon:yes gene_type:complete
LNNIPQIGQGIGDYKWDDSNVKLIREAALNGFNLIDTAESYDKGNSEKIVAKSISGIRDQVLISTKFSPENNSFNGVLNSIEKSLERLKTNYIDIYQLHWPNPEIPINETVRALLHLKKAQKIRFVGFGNLSLNELKIVNKLIQVDFFQVEYNLFDRYIEPAIYDFCLANNILILGYSPLDQGYIANGKTKTYLNEISRKYNKTPAQIAMKWLTLKSNIIPIPKFTKYEHYKELTEMDFYLEKKDIDYLEKNKTYIEYIPPSDISVINEGQNNRLTYTNISEARSNKLNFIPSPIQLAKTIKNDCNIKPIRLVKNAKLKYNLIEGRMRYWGWVLAFGDQRPIPSYIRRI